MSENAAESQGRIVTLLEEILKWIKITSVPQVKRLLSEIFVDEREGLTYHLSDGRGSEEVARNVGYRTHTAILALWKKWFRLGLVAPVKVRGGERYVRLFSLEDFGIDVPERDEGAEAGQVEETAYGR